MGEGQTNKVLVRSAFEDDTKNWRKDTQTVLNHFSGEYQREVALEIVSEGS